MKYVIVKDQLGVEYPLLFPEQINHNTVQKFDSRHGLHESVSAGFAIYENGKWNAYGESMTLNLKSRPKKDSELLNDFFLQGDRQ